MIEACGRHLDPMVEEETETLFAGPGQDGGASARSHQDGGASARSHLSPSSADPFMLYLLGVVLLDRREEGAFVAEYCAVRVPPPDLRSRFCSDAPCRKKRDQARQALLQSISLYPCNWSAWQVHIHLLMTHKPQRSLKSRP